MLLFRPFIHQNIGWNVVKLSKNAKMHTGGWLFAENLPWGDHNQTPISRLLHNEFEIELYRMPLLKVLCSIGVKITENKRTKLLL